MMLTLRRICSVSITSVCSNHDTPKVPGNVSVIFQLVTHITCIYSLVVYGEEHEST